MATTFYPPISHNDLLREEELSASRELDWLLSSLTETIASIRNGLHECTTLLAPADPGSTLALSSVRSEALKGYVTRVGNRIVKGDMQVKLHGLPNTKGLQAYKLTLAAAAGAPDRALMLEQLTDVNNFVKESLRLLGDDGGGGGGGRASCLGEAAMERLCELQGNIKAARAALKGTGPHRLFPYHAVDSRVFDPPLHPHLSFDLYVSEAALTAELRLLELIPPSDAPKAAFSLASIPSLAAIDSTGGFGQRFAAAVGLRGGLRGNGDSQDEVFAYRGMNVRVRERVKVESQDPNLMAVWAKLGGLEHALGLAIKSLAMVSAAAGVK